MNDSKKAPTAKETFPAKKQARAKTKTPNKRRAPAYPRYSLEKSLRIPRAILDQNAGRDCTDEESAKYAGMKFNKGPYGVEINTAIRYGLLSRPAQGRLSLTKLARKILRPQESDDYINGMRQAVMAAPVISDIYTHYRGENLPDKEFFNNALIEKFKIPEDKLNEFSAIFFDTLKSAELVTEHEGKNRIIDKVEGQEMVHQAFKKLEKNTKVSSNDSCFVMMPFRNPYGGYYDTIYKPAIEKAGLIPIRADAEIFGTGKIIDQIWSGINESTVLIAELTTRNPNVFYELGLAHALQKPVVLVSSNEDDVPFDLTHIRVIYYDQTNPFWGQMLMDKVSENILSAIQSPEEAIFQAVNK